jgi:ATP-binding cassette, subfamily C, bacterial LapB
MSQPQIPSSATAAIATAHTPRLREDLVHPDPLLDCLVAVCQLHGVTASRASLASSLPLNHEPLNLDLAAWH